MDKPNKKAKITAVQEPKKVLSKLHTHTHTHKIIRIKRTTRSETKICIGIAKRKLVEQDEKNNKGTSRDRTHKGYICVNPLTQTDPSHTCR